MVHNKIKDQLDGRPMFFIEEYEDDNIPFDGENYEEMPKKVVRQRKVRRSFFVFKTRYVFIIVNADCGRLS